MTWVIVASPDRASWVRERFLAEPEVDRRAPPLTVYFIERPEPEEKEKPRPNPDQPKPGGQGP